jgi:hypothetical protein
MESLPSIDALLAKMEKYCGDNLLSEFWLGGVQLFADLQKK